MPYQFEQHFDDESLESYSLGTLTEARSELLEEHLLICDGCRTRLDTTESYLKAMARGSLRLRQESAEPTIFAKASGWFRLPAMVWAPAAAMALCLIVFLSTASLRRGSVALAPITASLVAERGAAQPVPAHHPLLLHLDTRGLDLKSPVQMTLVDATGNKLEDQTTSAGSSVDFKSSRPLEPGAYYLRILKPGSPEPAREFALDVR